jgi:hypothetical protein
MEIRRASGILGAAFISIGLVACGGPDIDKVKADFQNPSGKTSDKSGVIAAQGKQSSSSGAMQVGVGGVPGLGGDGLTAVGKDKGFVKASAARLMIPQAERIRSLVQKTPVRQFALDIAQAEGGDCGDAEATAALGEDLAVDAADGEASGSFSFSVDFSSCAGSGLTGKATYNVDYEVSQTAFDMTVSLDFDAVCQENGDCITGSMLMNMNADGGVGAAGSFETITAWDLTATTDGKEITTKGGIKMGFDDLGSSIEILVYVNTADGEEWSYVLKATQGFNGEGMLEIRGSDGNATCTWHADGNGQCTGDAGALEWTAEESDAVESEEWFAE